MPTKKPPTSGPGTVTLISGWPMNVPDMPRLAVEPHGIRVEPKEQIAVTDVSGFDAINWKVKAD